MRSTRRADTVGTGLAETAKPAGNRHRWWGIAGRVVTLGLGAVSLYLLAPKLISIFTSWPELKTLKPLWVALALGFEALSYVSLWSMQRVALNASSWFAVGTSQLASG